MDLDEPVAWYRRPWVWVALVVTAVVLVVAVGWWGVSGEDSPSTPPAHDRSGGPSSTTAAPSESAAAGDADLIGRVLVVPGNPYGDSLPQDERASEATVTDPLTKPHGLQWQKVFGVPVPATNSDGPATITSDGAAVGFSRTPQGAAVASLQILFRALYADPAVRQKVIDSQVTGSAADVTALREVNVADMARYQTVPAALRIVEGNYSSDVATIEWAFGPFPAPEDHPTDTGNVWTSKQLTMVWLDGQWKLRATAELTADTEEPIVESISRWSSWF